MNILPATQHYATNITQSHLNASYNQNLGYAEKDTTNKNLQGAATSSKNIKATPPTEYINNLVLETYNKEQNLQNLSFQNISPVNLSTNNNTNINHQSNPATTATVITNTFCTKKPTSILHTKTHAEVKPYKCSYQNCDKEFKRNSHLQRHVRTHTGEKPYKCTKCSKAFTQKTVLQRHVRTHTGEKHYKCTECSKAFTQKTVLQRHVRTHTGEKPYKCTECVKAFIMKNELKRHVRTHTGEKPYKCTYINCDKEFNRKYTLQQHIRTHTGEKPYKCTNKDCYKAFSQSYVLTKHIRTHTGDKPYKCSYQDCDKEFIQKIDLQRHVRTHTGDKPYKCSYQDCDKEFKIKANLQCHIRTHTGERPYKCTDKDCNKAFKQPSNLQRHVRTHTRDKTFKCPECKKKFSQKNGLKRHISTLHYSKEILTYKKQPLKHSYNQSDNTFKQNECFKDNNLHKDQSLIVDQELLNVSRDVPKIAPEIVATPEVNATSENELMIIKTEPLDYEYNQGSFFKIRSYEHKIDNTLPILQDPNNPSKSLLQDKLKWFKKLTYQNFLKLQSYIITKSSIKNYNIPKSQSNIIKILKKIKQLIDWSTIELHMNSEEINGDKLDFIKDTICIEIIEWLFLNEYNIEDYTNKLNNYVTSTIPIDDKADRGVSVFANKDINKLDVIGPYAGALVNDKELNNRYEMYGEANICSYLFGTKFKTLAIDGYMTGNILSCINTAKLSHFAAIGENNLVPIMFANHIIFFVAIKHIPKDTELFINYGDCYKTREEIKQEMTED